jgi:heme-degrading monooxygenase HmoA
MVIEHAIFPVKPGQGKEFEAAWAQARKIIESAKGCLKADMRQGIENPDSFMLLVVWETLEDHMQGFRQSPAIKEFGALLAPFFAGAPSMDHYGQPL